MMGRIAVLAALVALAGCAGVQSAGRNAPRTEMPPPPAEAAPLQESAPAQTAQAQPPAMNTPEQEEAIRQEEEEEGAIVVPGQREMQVQPPSGDPRSVAERTRDVRAWDQCIMGSQSAFESDPMRPQLDSPEEYCSRNLGMAGRTAVPASRR